MKSTIETFALCVKPQFSSISDYAVKCVESGIFKAIQEDLRRQVKENGTGTVTMPWGTYKADNQKGSNGGNYNVELVFSQDFINALSDPKKSVYQEEFTDEFMQLFCDYTMFDRAFAPDMDEAKKIATAGIKKGVRLQGFQSEYFINAYADMILKAGQQHYSVGELYRIHLCDMVEHGTIEIVYTEDGAVPQFEAEPAFKQWLKNDNASDE